MSDVDMESDQDVELFSVGGGAMSADDAYDIDVTGIAEDHGSEPLPSGRYVLQCVAQDIPHVTVRTSINNKTGALQKIGKLVTGWTVQDVLELPDVPKDQQQKVAESLLERKHMEFSFPLSDKRAIETSIGQLKAIAHDGGLLADGQSPKTLDELRQVFAGGVIIANILRRTSKSGFVSARLDLRSITPYVSDDQQQAE